MTSLSPLPWLHVAVHLGVALVLGAVIGLDREYSHKAAGLRTNMLVSLGSALFMTATIQSGMAEAESTALPRSLQGIITGVGRRWLNFARRPGAGADLSYRRLGFCRGWHCRWAGAMAAGPNGHRVCTADFAPDEMGRKPALIWPSPFSGQNLTRCKPAGFSVVSTAHCCYRQDCLEPVSEIV